MRGTEWPPQNHPSLLVAVFVEPDRFWGGQFGSPPRRKVSRHANHSRIDIRQPIGVSDQLPIISTGSRNWSGVGNALCMGGMRGFGLGQRNQIDFQGDFNVDE
jgi:hypothetical protein